jgi:cytochrome c oxidase cbb3-type subunit 2
MYDHPFQWGSKRTGPDLARVGGRYSDGWHVAHLADPRSVVPESIMPGYPFLAETPLRLPDVAAHLSTNRTIGVPYSDEMIERAAQDLAAQANPDSDGAAEVAERYPGAVVSNFDGNAARLSELDAMIAYLQVLGTLVDFEAYQPEANYR